MVDMSDIWGTGRTYNSDGATHADVNLVHAFICALESTPSPLAHAVERAQVGVRRTPSQVVIEASIAGKVTTLVVEAKKSVFPRDVRHAILGLRAREAQVSGLGAAHTMSVLIADVISPGARTELRTNGIGYYDRSGSLFMPIAGAFVYVDCSPSKSRLPTSRAIFQGRKAQVLFTVFERRAHWVSVKEIADASGVSAATVSQTLMELERRKWMRSRGGGPAKLRRLIDAKALIAAWSRDLREDNQTLHRYWAPTEDQDIAYRLAKACDQYGVAYAVTGEGAAHLCHPDNPAVARVLCRMVSGPGAKHVLNALGARPADSMSNLDILEARSAADLTGGQRLCGVQLARPLQIYLDLPQGSGGVDGRVELFQHLRLEG